MTHDSDRRDLKVQAVDKGEGDSNTGGRGGHIWESLEMLGSCDKDSVLSSNIHFPHLPLSKN